MKSYQEFAYEGLIRLRKNKTYTFEFNMSVVELYLTTKISYQELALIVGINNTDENTKQLKQLEEVALGRSIKQK